ncbi:MAG: hypothetical protein Q8P67_27205 [archaeon]|nr:hypothetical protein [archaeon]
MFETEKGAKGEPPLQVFPTPVPMGFSRHLQDGEVVKALAAGRAHTSALTSLGRVLCWGANEKGQLGDGTLLSHAAPSTCLLPEESFVVGLSCGADFSLALTADGHLYAWGCGSDGQLGSALGRIATPLPVLVQFPPNLMPLKAIAGFRHALCILSSS